MADAGEIKNINTDMVRRVLKQEGTLSKNVLSRITGLSFSTISRLVDNLVLSNELIEKGSSGSTGGRCAQLYALNPLFQVTLSLRLEAEKIGWFVSDLEGNCLEKGNEQCKSSALEAIDSIITNAQKRYPQLGAIAMGLAGTIYKGTVTEMFGYDELRGINLLEHIKEKSLLPAVIEGDMIVASMGYCSHCKEIPKAAVCIYLGRSGIGAGTVIGGNVWSGVSEFAGELHYLPIENNIEYARTNFAGADMVDYYSKIIRSYIAIINPDRIILYENDFILGKIDEIRKKTLSDIPLQAVPQINISKNFDDDYEHGLAYLSYNMLGRS